MSGIPDFEDMFDHAPCGYLALLPNGRIELANETFLRWIGHELDAVKGKRFSDFLNIAGRVFFETHIAPLLTMQGGFDGFAIDLITSDDQPLPMIASAIGVRGTDGKALFTKVVLIKAADRRLYERDILNARDAATTDLAEVQETSALREQFIAVLGHDLRNPLASISAGARILGRDAKTDKERQVIAMLETTVLRMAGLIDNVMDFARGRLGGGIPLNRNSVHDIVPVLHQVVDELRMSSPGRLIETEFAIEEPVECDRGRIGQLVSNLLGNALSHGSSGQPIRVRALTADGLFTVSVSNGGSPIPEAAMHKLFEPFFRGEVRESQQGLGLGLHIASQIAKAHDGTLTVVSDENETRFTFAMPLRVQVS